MENKQLLFMIGGIAMIGMAGYYMQKTEAIPEPKKVVAHQRKMIIGGNWKSNGTLKSVKELITNVLNKADFDSSKLEVVVAPISMHISTVQPLLNENIQVACQNMGATSNGAFTGEISGEQLKDFGVKWTLVGHSERRVKYDETNEIIATKVARAQVIGINAIVCIGESLAQREAGETNSILQSQLEAFKPSVKDWNKIVLAYEPVWAIGTGKVATPEIAEAAHAFIRQWMTKNVSEHVSHNIRIQYGGSVSAKNAAELISQPNIDGFLVGGASLKPDFLQIIDACNQAPCAYCEN